MKNKEIINEISKLPVNDQTEAYKLKNPFSFVLKKRIAKKKEEIKNKY